MAIALLLALLNTANAAPSESYFDAGVTLGYPGGFNATGAYWRGQLGARGTLGYGGYSSGAQLTGLYRFGEVRPMRASHSVGITTGHTEIAGNHSTYLAAVYEMDLRRGFYLQTGLGLAQKANQPVQALISMGYVRRFHPKVAPEPG